MRKSSKARKGRDPPGSQEELRKKPKSSQSSLGVLLLQEALPDFSSVQSLSHV